MSKIWKFIFFITFMTSLNLVPASSILAANKGRNTGPLVNAGFPSTTAGLLNYLNNLSANGKILSGQMDDHWNGDQPMDQVNQIISQTGEAPAILGLPLEMGDNPNLYAVQNVASLANTWIASGGLVLISAWSLNPSTGGSEQDTNINFHDLLVPGTTAYTNWYQALDLYAQRLHAITDSGNVAMLRPFVEVNGNWFWWGNQNPSDFIAVWKQMHDYLTITKGVKNLLWVYNVNTGQGNYSAYYPGDKYADILSMDSYPPTKDDAPMYAALLKLNKAPHTAKPIIYAEIGVISASPPPVFAANNNDLLQLIKANFPKVSAVSVWCQTWALPDQNGEAQFMSDPAIVNL